MTCCSGVQKQALRRGTGSSPRRSERCGSRRSRRGRPVSWRAVGRRRRGSRRGRGGRPRGWPCLRVPGPCGQPGAGGRHLWWRPPGAGSRRGARVHPHGSGGPAPATTSYASSLPGEVYRRTAHHKKGTKPRRTNSGAAVRPSLAASPHDVLQKGPCRVGGLGASAPSSGRGTCLPIDPRSLACPRLLLPRLPGSSGAGTTCGLVSRLSP